MLGRGVDDRGDLAADEGVGADPVDVDVVDDGDVAGAQPLGEVLRATVQPGGAGLPGARLLGPAAPKGADAHAPHAFTRACDARSSDARRRPISYAPCATPRALRHARVVASCVASGTVTES